MITHCCPDLQSTQLQRLPTSGAQEDSMCQAKVIYYGLGSPSRPLNCYTELISNSPYISHIFIHDAYISVPYISRLVYSLPHRELLTLVSISVRLPTLCEGKTSRPAQDLFAWESEKRKTRPAQDEGTAWRH